MPQYPIRPEAEMFPLIEGEAFTSLVNDIRERGLEDDIELYEGAVIDGRNRLRACTEAGVEPRYRDVTADVTDPLGYVVSKNLVRRHLTASEMATVIVKAKDLFVERARARQQEGRRRGGRRAAQADDASPTSGGEESESAGFQGEWAEEAAASFGRPSLVRTIQRADELARRDPEAFERAHAGQATVSAALVASKIREQRAAIAAEPLPLPDGQFRCIVADPPWAIGEVSEDANYDPGSRAPRPATGYPTMTQQEIEDLGPEVRDRAHNDCVLFLWGVNGQLPEALAVMQAWGFEYKTILTWDKSPRFGVGYWLRTRSEYVLIGTRGNPTRGSASEVSIIHEAPGAHSKKPEAFYQLVERLCPGSKLEMFSRQARDGWVAWGDQANAEAAS